MNVELTNLSIGYRHRHSTKTVSENICATIRKGELTCLLGQNGTGKSTLLRTLSYFLPRLDGDIIINGHAIDSYSEHERARLISVVLTEKPEVTNMTVREMIAMGRMPYTGFWGRLKNEDEEIIDKAAEMVGITGIITRKVSSLSDGERQKVMIAKALAQQTPIIYLDEPTAFLDYPSKVETMELLQRVSHDTEKTVFLSTHDIELALQMADTVWLMNANGKNNMHTGSPEDLALDGSLESFFAGRGVCFDSDTGIFRINRPTTQTIHITGMTDSTAGKMLRKALRRYAIETTDRDNEQCGITIDIGSNYFTVIRPNAEKKTYFSIAETTRAIK
ncbi:ABC transporter ATP-binding protein [Xylanibacter muris]|uniref:ABC transporter ATP-binding protein n=1 Tax=Xylanibacter muris TaxID=2736290 RepID=A0ABX2AIN9_9BACT|nr:ABC transporter ATP-binding protein [Xylanibacter muris]NPD90908.1 ABC transporter ATP-binding protein [Xylanibacter muris]